MTAKQCANIATGVLLILIALWGGAWGWEFIDKEANVAFYVAMLCTQVLLVTWGLMIITLAGAETL